MNLFTMINASGIQGVGYQALGMEIAIVGGMAIALP
jgi:hypothetical protein